MKKTEIKAYTATNGYYTVMVIDEPEEEFYSCFLKKDGYAYSEMFGLSKSTGIDESLKISMANAEDYEFLFDDNE